MRRFSAVACVFAVVVVLVGGVSSPAFALDPPSTVPTITAPTNLSNISGVVTLTASSIAPAVQFLVDGNPVGGPVDVLGGVASTTWPSWGSPYQAFDFTAEDCNDAGCGSPSPAVTATVYNAPPTITSPANGATTNAQPTFSATSVGPAVGFQVDGSTRVVDTSAPFMFIPPNPLAEGFHTVNVVDCDATGTRCSNNWSQESFNVVLLHPLITSVTPSRFSPNGDGRDDTATVAFSLPGTESATWTIINGVDATVQGPNPLGSLAAGSHSFVWSGLDNSQTRVPDGTYNVVVSTTATVNGVDLTGSDTTSVVVDTTPPDLGTPTGGNAAFYPVHDGYRDTFTSKVSVNEAGKFSLVITTTGGHTVRVLAHTATGAGTISLSWNGRNSANHLVAAGTYHFHWSAQDLAGNRSHSGTYNVVVSLRHLVTHTTALVKTANKYDFVAGSASCAKGSASLSAFKPYGLLLLNHCNPATTQVAIAQYTFTVPAAISYTSVHISTYGFTSAPPIALGSAIWNFTHNDANEVGATAIFHNVHAWTSLGTITASQHVSSRHVEIAILLANATATARYDMHNVQLTITYKVLS
jgi:flagellar hook assembly protein FlgD